jgi:two-component system, NarL family, response regulator NreC
LSSASVLVVDDHPILREGIAQLVNREPDLRTVAEAGSVDEAISALAAQRVDLAIVDLSLQGRSGIELLKSMRSRFPETRTVVVSMHDENLYAERALRAGARGYVMKQEAPRKIVTALREVRAGNLYVSDRLRARLLERLVSDTPTQPTSPLSALTDRELEVLRLIGRGLKSGDIARTLKRSVNTVEAHRANIKRKLGLTSATELARFAFAALEAATDAE